MVIGTNSVPTDIPNLGCSEEGNLIQYKTAQLWYSMSVRQPWDQPAFQLGSSAAAPWCSALVKHLWCLTSTRKHSLQWGKWASQARGELAYIKQKFLPLVPEWSILMEMRTPSPHNLIGPKGTSLIGRMELLCLDGESLSLIGWNRIPGTPLQGLAQTVETRAGRQFSAGFSMKCSLHERLLCRNGC